MKRYLLVLALDYNIFAGRNELKIPFFAIDDIQAETKADAIISIWESSVIKAELFLLDTIQTWGVDN